MNGTRLSGGAIAFTVGDFLEEKMPGMNGTRLSDGAIAFAVGYFLELVAR
jgi:hypothetical protein